MQHKALILGASGRIGRHASAAFRAAGWEVVHFNRKTDDMTQAAKGCDVIVNGLNPPNYHAWDRLIPEITAQVIAAAEASGATVILPGNVYHFGNQGRVWSEETPPNPVSRKGRIRLEMERSYAASKAQVIVLRAGNFIDPDLQGCIMGALYLRKARAGKITLPGSSEVRQAFCYLPDWARAAVALVEKRDALAKFEDIPFPGHTLSADTLKSALEKTAGQKLGYARFPWFWLTIFAPFWELAREMREMRYLWDTDHALSPTRFKALLPGFQPTPLDQVLSVIWARAEQ